MRQTIPEHSIKEFGRKRKADLLQSKNVTEKKQKMLIGYQFTKYDEAKQQRLMIGENLLELRELYTREEISRSPDNVQQ